MSARASWTSGRSWRTQTSSRGPAHSWRSSPRHAAAPVATAACNAAGLKSGGARLRDDFHRGVGEEIGPALPHLLGSAAVDDATLLHHDHRVEPAQEMQPVDRGYDARAAERAHDAIVDLRFGRGIHAAGCL